MCRVLKISESGYYRWLKNRDKPTSRQLLAVEIQAILNEHSDNDNYGYSRMHTALVQKGIEVSECTVYRTMSEMGILHKRRTPRGTTTATTEIQDRENLIKRDFTADEPLKKLLSDITEIQCYDGKLYTSAVLDCHNGSIVSMAMDDNMKKELCIRTIEELKARYGKTRLEGAIFHSDRGSQYTSEAFRDALKDAGLVQSLSARGIALTTREWRAFLRR